MDNGITGFNTLVKLTFLYDLNTVFAFNNLPLNLGGLNDLAVIVEQQMSCLSNRYRHKYLIHIEFFKCFKRFVCVIKLVFIAK